MKRTLLLSIVAAASYGQVPVPVSVTPNSGSGLEQSFRVSYSDSRGYRAVQSSMVLINGPMTFTGSCSIYYMASSNSVYIVNDAGTAWQTPAVPLGQNATSQNSQCTLNVAQSWSSGNGLLLTLNLAITFKPTFTGLKGFWVEVYDNPGDSGWAQMGTWTVSTGEHRDVFRTVQPSYTLSASVKAGTLERVYLNGLLQAPGDDYALADRTLTFPLGLAGSPLIQVTYWPKDQ